MHPTPSEERRFAYLMKRTTYSRLKFLRFGYIPPPRNFPYELHSLRFFVESMKNFYIEYSFQSHSREWERKVRNKKLSDDDFIATSDRAASGSPPHRSTASRVGDPVRQNKFLRLALSYGRVRHFGPRKRIETAHTCAYTAKRVLR